MDLDEFKCDVSDCDDGTDSQLVCKEFYYIRAVLLPWWIQMDLGLDFDIWECDSNCQM